MPINILPLKLKISWYIAFRYIHITNASRFDVKRRLIGALPDKGSRVHCQSIYEGNKYRNLLWINLFISICKWNCIRKVFILD